MQLKPEVELLVWIAGKLNESIAERDRTTPVNHFYRGRVSAYALVLDKAQELGLPVASAKYLADPNDQTAKGL